VLWSVRGLVIAAAVGNDFASSATTEIIPSLADHTSGYEALRDIEWTWWAVIGWVIAVVEIRHGFAAAAMIVSTRKWFGQLSIYRFTMSMAESLNGKRDP